MPYLHDPVNDGRGRCVVPGCGLAINTRMHPRDTWLPGPEVTPTQERPDDEPDLFATSLPYAGTSGWSGSDTSRERAVTADESGETSVRQRAVMNMLASRGRNGMTWKELVDVSDMHHGSASGVLSVLHKDGRIERLKVARNRSKVYVLPEHVEGRETEPQGGKPKLTDMERQVLDIVERYLDSGGVPRNPDVAVLVAALRRLVD